jgi:hypothetical protein
MEALNRYVEHHIPTGSFLNAVLENNLKESIQRADEENLAALVSIVAYCYNEIPGPCWGSKEHVNRWIRNWGETKEGSES